MEFRFNHKYWKDAVTVIVIAFLPPFIASPYEKYVPHILSIILSHYSSTLGYMWLCWRAGKVEAKRITIVAALVWIIMMAGYTVMFWSQIGTKYTVKSIIWGGFLSEAVSVFVGSICYATGRDLRAYYKYYLKGSA